MAEAIRLVHSSGWIIQYIRALLRLWIMNRREAKVFWCRREKNTIDLCPIYYTSIVDI
jgi:hypothetical protein